MYSNNYVLNCAFYIRLSICKMVAIDKHIFNKSKRNGISHL